ncbi:MAG: hypothetical protein ACXV8R_07865 [Acidimicrobiia bacterium]
MRKQQVLGAALALTLTISGAALVSGGQAWAAKGPKGKTVCTTITGNASSTVTVSGCTDINGANTGGASQPIPIATLAGGGTVTWVSGKTTTFAAPTLTATNAKKCPGYVKGASSNPSADKFKGAVTADTSGMKVPGKFKGAVCISPSGDITALKPLKAN